MNSLIFSSSPPETTTIVSPKRNNLAFAISRCFIAFVLDNSNSINSFLSQKY